MKQSLYHTILRRTRTGWIALQMCMDQEMYRATARTNKGARKNLIAVIAAAQAEARKQNK